MSTELREQREPVSDFLDWVYFQESPLVADISSESLRLLVCDKFDTSLLPFNSVLSPVSAVKSH